MDAKINIRDLNDFSCKINARVAKLFLMSLMEISSMVLTLKKKKKKWNTNEQSKENLESKERSDYGQICDRVLVSSIASVIYEQECASARYVNSAVSSSHSARSLTVARFLRRDIIRLEQLMVNLVRSPRSQSKSAE